MASITSNFINSPEGAADHFLPLETTQDLNPLLDYIGDSRYVLLGEASHGTHEYYTWRAEITKRLLTEKGFNFIAVEGDWPDSFKINRWVKGLLDSGTSIKDVLNEFKRWPTWMWANWEIASLAQWLKRANKQLYQDQKVGFYGLDVYSLWESLEIMMEYLESQDPQTAALAKEVAACFEPYKPNDSYANAYRNMQPTCREGVVQLLTEVRGRMNRYQDEPESGLNAEVNALVMKNAERYYQAMTSFGNNSWNVRDAHMVEVLNKLVDFHGEDSKVIVWEHNTHIGDARATDMEADGVFNVGQLVREQHKDEGVVLVGMGSYKGSVIAGQFWGADMQEMRLPKAMEGSVEELLHRASAQNKLLIFKEDSRVKKALNQELGHRAVGVVYNPNSERGNYVPSNLSDRYDAFLYIDETSALHPLGVHPHGQLLPETYPFGI